MTTASSIAYCPLLGLAKFSILLLYLKLGPIRWFHVAVYITMFIVIGANFALIFAFIFACTPVKRGWDITITEGSCINRAALYIATAVLNMITDILLLLLPIPIVVRLQMPRIQKLGLILIFAIGSMYVCFSLSSPRHSRVKPGRSSPLASASSFSSPCSQAQTQHGPLARHQSGCKSLDHHKPEPLQPN